VANFAFILLEHTCTLYAYCNYWFRI